MKIKATFATHHGPSSFDPFATEVLGRSDTIECVDVEDGLALVDLENKDKRRIDDLECRVSELGQQTERATLRGTELQLELGQLRSSVERSADSDAKRHQKLVDVTIQRDNEVLYVRRVLNDLSKEMHHNRGDVERKIGIEACKTARLEAEMKDLAQDFKVMTAKQENLEGKLLEQQGQDKENIEGMNQMMKHQHKWQRHNQTALAHTGEVLASQQQRLSAVEGDIAWIDKFVAVLNGEYEQKIEERRLLFELYIHEHDIQIDGKRLLPTKYENDRMDIRNDMLYPLWLRDSVKKGNIKADLEMVKIVKERPYERLLNDIYGLDVDEIEKYSKSPEGSQKLLQLINLHGTLQFNTSLFVREIVNNVHANRSGGHIFTPAEEEAIKAEAAALRSSIASLISSALRLVKEHVLEPGKTAPSETQEETWGLVDQILAISLVRPIKLQAVRKMVAAAGMSELRIRLGASHPKPQRDGERQEDGARQEGDIAEPSPKE